MSTLLLSGCRVGPNFSPPDAYVQDEWLECENERVACAEPFAHDWWSYFEDPVLEDLVGRAYAQNLSVRTAAMQVLQARAELGIAIGEFFPQVQELVGSATRFGLSKNAPNFARADLYYWDFISGLQAAWELDFWGRFRRGIESAQADLCSSIANFEDVLVLLVSDVATNYVNLRTLEKRLEILLQNIAVQQRSLEIVTARFNAGAGTELDVQQAKNFLYDTLARLPDLENQIQATKNALAVLLGLTPNCMDALIPPSPVIPVAPPTIAVGIPAELLTRRPDVRRSLYDAAAQSARIGVAISNLLPSISIGGFLGFESSASTKLTKSGGGGKFFSKKSVTYFFGPSFAWPILNYGRLTNRVRVEYTLFYQQVLNYQNTVLFAAQEAENGLIAFIKAHEEVAELEKSVKAADRSTQLARTQYVEGIADYTRVLNTEQAKLDAEERLVISQGKIALSLVSTYKALGGGWQPFVGCEEE